ncbi:hypothetical protein PIB30_102133, partial [Stylosanthes scabra]|nr:hypothetical protein [Stylosanthes scabra]
FASFLSKALAQNSPSLQESNLVILYVLAYKEIASLDRKGSLKPLVRKVWGYKVSFVREDIRTSTSQVLQVFRGTALSRNAPSF